jgi:hypothetical protein
MAGTKRRRIVPRRLGGMPDWARVLIATGRRPAPDSPDGDAFFGWAFCGEAILGLPMADSPEGQRLWLERSAAA